MQEFNLKTRIVSSNARLFRNLSLKTEYRNSMMGLILELQSQMRKNGYKQLLSNSLRLEVHIFRNGILKFDLDNCLKIIGDSLTIAHVIKDDRYITEINVKKIESEKEFTYIKVCENF